MQGFAFELPACELWVAGCWAWFETVIDNPIPAITNPINGSLFFIAYFQSLLTYFQHAQLNDVFVRTAQPIQHRTRWRLIQINARDGGLRAFKDDVLHLLHIDLFGFDRVEHLRQNAGTIAMTHDQTMRRWRALRQVHNIWHLAGFLERLNDADRLGRDRLL